MKHIALYGGSFDPPHLGHVITIAAVLNSKLADEIWLVPTGLRRDKDHQASPDHRKTMISIMLATMFGSKMPVFLNTTQINQSWQISTTADLVEEMQKLYPDHRFSFIIGSDLVADIPRWHKAEKLMKKGFFLMVQRLGTQFEGKLPDYVLPVPLNDVALTNISSSIVRKMIANGQRLEGIVPPAVMSHMLRNGLYQKAETNEKDKTLVICHGRFLRFCSVNGWEFVERNNCTGVVFVVALTPDRKIILTEQFRIPVNKRVIELPAGLVNDRPGKNEERMEDAASRELLEETGYEAKKIIPLLEGPISAGMTSEIATLFYAPDVIKTGNAEGDGTESITTHCIPLAEVKHWLEVKKAEGCLVDPKIYAGLFAIEKQ